MPNRAAGALLASAALLVGGCKTEAPNPFVPPARTARLPADAALLFTSDAYTTAVGAPREVFAARQDGGGVQRITFCNGEEQACDTIEAVASPDRRRLVMRRASSDTNGDGRVLEPDDAGLVAVDLERGLEVTIVQPASKVTGVDWSLLDELVIYSAAGGGGEDLFAIQANGRDNRTIIFSPDTAERRPRLNRTATAALYERIGADGKAAIWVVSTGTVPVTQGGPGSEPLPATPYVVGADADPAFSPDGRAFVFRRLTGTGLPPFGTWDLLTGAFEGSAPRAVVGGAAFRGAPDWGAQGIVFPEFDGSSWRIVAMAADGSNRRVLLTLATGQRLTSVRWLP